jgi:hypothetical protein
VAGTLGPMKRLSSFVVVSIAFLLPAALLAWRPEGHEVVAALAESLLSDTAKSGVQPVIGNATLASVSNWADQVRSQRDETYNWHFVDIPKSAAGFSEDRDCFLPTNSYAGAATDHYNCVVDRITLFKEILADTSKLLRIARRRCDLAGRVSRTSLKLRDLATAGVLGLIVRMA